MILSHGQNERFVAAICEGVARISVDRLKHLAKARDLVLASPEDIYRVTRHPPGGVPAILAFGLVEQVFIDEAVLEHDFVVGSAGTEYCGLRFSPRVLTDLGGQVGRIAE